MQNLKSATQFQLDLKSVGCVQMLDAAGEDVGDEAEEQQKGHEM